MSSGPFDPVALSDWAQVHVTSLFGAPTVTQFNEAFDALFAHHVDNIIVNGRKLSKEQYKAFLLKERAPESERSAAVNVVGVVAATDEKEGQKVCVSSTRLRLFH